MAETIGFIGLGDLGLPVAANLLEAGYPLKVYNRTASKADPLVSKGAERVEQPADVVTTGGVVVTLLWDAAAVESVMAADVLERLGPGGVHVSMSTLSPEESKALAGRHAQHGSHLVEAPIFGRPDAAAAKRLWIPYAGSQAAKDRVLPLLNAMGALDVFDFGEQIGAATTVKLVGNFLLISAAASMMEGLTLVERNGFDVQAAVDMLTQTLFPSPIYQGVGRMVVSKTFGADQSGIPAKDLGLFKETAERLGAPSTLSDLLLEQRRRASA